MFTSIVGTASVPARGSTFMRPVPPMMPPSLCSSSAHRFICITADQPRCGRLRASMLLRVGLLAAPLAADGQQPGKMWRIGYLGTFPMDPQSRDWERCRAGPPRARLHEGQNLHIERRFSERKVVRSLARPGGNVTGLTSIEWEAFTAKQLEVLKDAAQEQAAAAGGPRDRVARARAAPSGARRGLRLDSLAAVINRGADATDRARGYSHCRPHSYAARRRSAVSGKGVPDRFHPDRGA